MGINSTREATRAMVQDQKPFQPARPERGGSGEDPGFLAVGGRGAEIRAGEGEGRGELAQHRHLGAALQQAHDPFGIAGDTESRIEEETVVGNQSAAKKVAQVKAARWETQVWCSNGFCTLR